MDFFQQTDYRQLIKEWVQERPKSGHGQMRKMALHAGINSVVISQVMSGLRDFTLEQALSVAQFMCLPSLEREYFLLLVQKSRAGTEDLKQFFEQQAKLLRERSKKLRERIEHKPLTEEAKSIFYSKWQYSAVRLGLSIPNWQNYEAISRFLGIDRRQLIEIIEFLLAHQLLVDKEGRLQMGPQVTHIGNDSPHVSRHQANWRVKALANLDHPHKSDLFYTGPMVLSNETAEDVRAMLAGMIKEVVDKVVKSPSETLRCLNIDWFQVGGD